MAQIVVPIEQAAALFASYGARVPSAVLQSMRLGMLDAQRDVVRNRLSGQYLGVRTGTARKSIATETTLDGAVVRGAFGSHLRYVRAHELGFDGAVQVRSHTRQLRRIERNARGKVTKRSASEYKRSAGRTSVAYVRAHARQVRMRARHFFRDTMRQLVGQIGQGPTLQDYVRAALDYLARTGKVPTLGQIKGAV